MNKTAIEQVSEILVEVRKRISIEMGMFPKKLVPIPKMAKRIGGVNYFSLYRWYKGEPGSGLPDHQSVTIMSPYIAQILNDPSMERKLFEICGHRIPAKRGDIDPRLQWMIDHQDNPGIQHVLGQIEEQGEAILSHKPDKADSHVRLVTIATP